jgi:hypothetical protein
MSRVRPGQIGIAGREHRWAKSVMAGEIGAIALAIKREARKPLLS